MSKCDFVKKLSRVRCPHRQGVSVDGIEQQYCNDFFKKRAWNCTRRIYVVCAEKRSSSSISLTFGIISWNDTDKGRQIVVNVRSLLEEQETIRSDPVDSVFAVTHQLESFKRLLHCDNQSTKKGRRHQILGHESRTLPWQNVLLMCKSSYLRKILAGERHECAEISVRNAGRWQIISRENVLENFVTSFTGWNVTSERRSSMMKRIRGDVTLKWR